MKQHSINILILVIGLSLVGGGVRAEDPCGAQPVGVRHGPYLGETIPGASPKVFAPNLVTTECSEHSVPVFSPDGQEAVWTRMIEGSRKARLFYTREETEGWTEPRIARFITGGDAFYPFFSTDGTKLYFVSRDMFGRSLKVSCREQDSWSRPRKVGSPLKSKQLMWSAAASADGTVYFVMHDDRRQEWIYRTRLVGDDYAQVERLGEGVNRPSGSASTPFIAPDESYLLFSSPAPGGAGMWDLYVSFPEADGSWSEACNLGPAINTEANEDSPWVTMDGKYLFFIRHCDVFWVDAQVIKQACGDQN